MKKLKVSQINFSKCPRPQSSPVACSSQLLNTVGPVEPGGVSCLPQRQYFFLKRKSPQLHNFVQGVGVFLTSQAVLKDNKHRDSSFRCGKTWVKVSVECWKKELFPY